LKCPVCGAIIRCPRCGDVCPQCGYDPLEDEAEIIKQKTGMSTFEDKRVSYENIRACKLPLPGL